MESPVTCKSLFVGDYELGRSLGSGNFSQVRHATHAKTGAQVAIKIMDKAKIKSMEMETHIKHEISVMSAIKHQNIVNMIEVMASKTKIFLVLELVTGGELFDRIAQSGRFDEATARKHFRQLVSGLGFCHAAGICHRDLKPENLLLDSAGNLRISDFGLSALTQQYSSASGGIDEAASSEPSATASILRTTCGTPSYCAPEVLLSSVKGYDGAAADMWSCGVILYVLLTGFLPFDDPAMPALFKKIVKAEFQYPEWVSLDARSLIDFLLLVDPEQRLSCQAVRAHAWMQSDGLVSPTPKHASSSLSTATAFSFQDQHEAFLQVPEPEEGNTGDLCLPTLNAFDIINMVGGTAISRMFQTRAAPTAGSVQDAPTASTAAVASAAQTSTQFTSDLPLAEIMERIGDALAHLNAATKIHDRLCKGKFQLERGSSVTPPASAATCAGTFQVYAVTQGVHCVEFIRERGDLLAFDAFYRDLRDLFFAAERAPAFARGLHRQRSTERRERGQSHHLSVDWSASSPNRLAALPGSLASSPSP